MMNFLFFLCLVLTCNIAYADMSCELNLKTFPLYVMDHFSNYERQWDPWPGICEDGEIRGPARMILARKDGGAAQLEVHALTAEHLSYAMVVRNGRGKTVHTVRADLSLKYKNGYILYEPGEFHELGFMAGRATIQTVDGRILIIPDNPSISKTQQSGTVYYNKISVRFDGKHGLAMKSDDSIHLLEDLQGKQQEYASYVREVEEIIEHLRTRSGVVVDSGEALAWPQQYFDVYFDEGITHMKGTDNINSEKISIHIAAISGTFKPVKGKVKVQLKQAKRPTSGTSGIRVKMRFMLDVTQVLRVSGEYTVMKFNARLAKVLGNLTRDADQVETGRQFDEYADGLHRNGGQLKKDTYEQELLFELGPPNKWESVRDLDFGEVVSSVRSSVMGIDSSSNIVDMLIRWEVVSVY